MPSRAPVDARRLLVQEPSLRTSSVARLYPRAPVHAMSFAVIVIEIMLPIAIAVTAVKLIAMPLIIWGMAASVAVPIGEPARAAIIEAAMPTLLMAILLADRFRLDTEAASLMIGWRTVLFWLIPPLWLTLFA